MTENGPLRLLTYDRIEVGIEYSRREYAITTELVSAYAVAMGATGGEVAKAAATLPAMWTPPRICFENWEIPVGGIHTEQEWISYAACTAGDVLRLRVTAVDKFIRENRQVVVFGSVFDDQNGRKIAEGRMTIIWPR